MKRIVERNLNEHVRQENAAYREIIQKRMDAERQVRRRRVADCVYCKTITESGAPMHDASPRCESGHRNHCTCDTCF